MSNNIMIYFTNNTETPVTYALKILMRRSVTAALAYEGFYNDAEVSVTFTDNEGIRALNSEFRGIDKETDVLSFPLTDFEGGDEPPADEPSIMLGDIVISLERAAEQAKEMRIPLRSLNAAPSRIRSRKQRRRGCRDAPQTERDT